MGRKRKVPVGLIPKWISDSESTSSDVEINLRPGFNDFPTEFGPTGQHPLPSISETIPLPEQYGQVYVDTGPADLPPPANAIIQGTHAHEEQSDEARSDVLLHPQEVLVHRHETDEESTSDPFDFLTNLPHYYEDEDEVEEEEEEESEVQEHPHPEMLPEMPLEEESEEENQQQLFYEDGEEEEVEEEEVDVDTVDKDSFSYILNQFSEEWIVNETDHNVSKRASSAFWSSATKWMIPLSSAFMKEKKKKFPQLPNIRKKLVKQNVPPVSMDTGYVHKETGKLTVVSGSDRTPTLNFPRNQYEKVFEIGSVKVLIIIVLELCLSCLFLLSAFSLFS